MSEGQEFLKECKEVRNDFVAIAGQYTVGEHLKLRTEIDTLLIMYDQLCERVRLEDSSNENSGLHKHGVNGCGFTTADNYEIDPITTKVYFYPTWATDGYPSHGLMEFDNEEREWKNYHNSDVPVFFKRENVDKYIESRHCR